MGTQKSIPKASKNEEAVAVDLSTKNAMLMASNRIIKNIKQSPKSATEFENRWKALRDDHEKQRELLATLVQSEDSDTKDIPTIFKSSLSGEILYEILYNITVYASAENL